MNFNRVVIKVGSALVSPDAQGCSGKYILAIARFITQCQQAGKEVILVSSGSVAAGRGLIAHGSSNPSIPTKQAMASVGQMKMMANWQRFFDVPCSQLLITHGDLKDRQRYISIKNTLRILLENGVIPIVNENDTVATEELKVGDNDNLAALVAVVSEADSLFILSDVDGVFEEDPRINPQAKLIPVINKIDDAIYAMAGATNNSIATGGMKTKIQAAEKAVENGIETYIFNGSRGEIFEQILRFENPGTHFVAKESATRARKHWLKHTLKSSGTVLIDVGAVSALNNKGASLLPSGVADVTGNFKVGDCIDIYDAKNGQHIAKGISQYNTHDLKRIKGCKSDEINTLLGYCPSKVVIHRDDMVMLK
ncbi:MAG: glutamate 5-kinase [Colwellia polaris]|jgi:glutamate 5-kinase|uniref:glutamate 5-kinase n=1 Tax=Colwellia polaris TaxID=326537 RepID=UPI000A171908|nr:glutamate 5-kinase [Colwellia polaris]|tara:strand:+ start:823 stop:1923 length:1101 start_codon:yes stop_codon:yes gene_type:complete